MTIMRHSGMDPWGSRLVDKSFSRCNGQVVSVVEEPAVEFRHFKSEQREAQYRARRDEGNHQTGTHRQKREAQYRARRDEGNHRTHRQVIGL